MRERSATGLSGRPRGITRRGFVRSAGAGVGAAALLGAACRTGVSNTGQQGAKSGSSPSTAKKPKMGGVLTYGGGNAGSYDTRGPSFDPHQNFQFAVKGYTL